MARMRTLKPEFCTSESISVLSERAELHFAKLWTYADDEGRGVDNARLIKAACWPLRDTVSIEDVEALQVELAERGRIRRYVAGQRAYFQVTNWSEHQHPQKPKPSVIPPEASGTPPAKRRRRTVRVRDGDGTDTGAVSPVVVVGEGVVVVEGEGEGEEASGGPPDFEAFWSAYPRKTDRKAAEVAWPKATKKMPPGDLVAAAVRYATDPNREDAFTLHPTTWLNRERWNDPPLPPRINGRESVGDHNVRLLLGRQEARRAMAGRELQP